MNSLIKKADLKNSQCHSILVLNPATGKFKGQSKMGCLFKKSEKVNIHNEYLKVKGQEVKRKNKKEVICDIVDTHP